MQHKQTGFRRDGRQVHEWRRWVTANQDLINAIALPTDVVATRQEFDYFLMHGYNRAGWWNKQPWFEVLRAETLKRDRFWALLESYVAAFYPPGDHALELEALARTFRPTSGAA